MTVEIRANLHYNVRMGEIDPHAQPGEGPGLKNKTILVTGAAGFIGSHLVRELRRRPAGSVRHGVAAAAAAEDGERSTLAPLAPIPGLAAASSSHGGSASAAYEIEEAPEKRGSRIRSWVNPPLPHPPFRRCIASHGP